MLIRTCLIATVITLVSAHSAAGATLQPKTLKAWETYVQLTESRINRELNGSPGFLITDFMTTSDASKARALLLKGGIVVQKRKTVDARSKDIDTPDGLIHHWYGAVFIPNVRLESVLSWIQNYDQHKKYFKEVEDSKLLSRSGDTYRAYLRLTRTKVVTVHYNTEHSAIYKNYGNGRASSSSLATKIAQIDDPGTATEKELPAGNDSGYLWRLNSYWRFKEQGGGVVVECESLSLSRSIPFGLGMLIGGFVESVPSESLENTLTSIRDGVAGKTKSRE